MTGNNKLVHLNLYSHTKNIYFSKTPDFLNISLPNLRDIFISASIARSISRLKIGQVNNMKFKNTRSFNGKFDTAFIAQ